MTAYNAGHHHPEKHETDSHDDVGVGPDGLKGRVTREWKQYAEGTTMHGIRYVADSNVGILRRVFWFLVIAALLIGLAINFEIQFRRFFEYKTITKTYVEYDESPHFPAVTICNMNQIRNSSVQDEKMRKLLVETFVNQTPDEKLVEEYSKNVTSKEIVDCFREGVHNESMKFCEWMGTIVKCKDISTPTLTDVGFCYTFNSKEFIQKTNITVKASGTGTENGLKITLGVEQWEYFIGDSASAGFKVLVHDQDSEPYMRTTALSVGPGVSHFLSIQKARDIYQPEPSLAFGNEKCVDTNSPDFVNLLQQHPTYGYYPCIEECRVRYIVKKCNCKGVFDKGDHPICPPSTLITCVKNAQREFTSTATNDCGCTLPCTLNYYNVEMSSAYFPNDNFIQTLYGVDYPNEILRKNLLELRVYYGTKLISVREQLLEYSSEDLYGYIGGMLGLCMGASLSTIVEFIEFVIFGIICCFRKR